MLRPMSASRSARARGHPLDQLSAAEIERTAAILRDHPRFPRRPIFRVIGVKEPSRAAVRAFEQGGGRPRRLAYASVFDRDKGHAIEAVVDLTVGMLRSFDPVDGRLQPGIPPVESAAVHRRVRTDTRWRSAMRARGIENLEQVAFETGPAGRFGGSFDSRRRLGRTLTFLRPPGTLNYYAHPVQGLVVLVDLLTEEVLEVLDEGVVRVPTQPHEFHEPIEADRPPLREIEIRQPAGASFTMTAGLLEWQNWSLRVGLDPIDGLVLQRVGYRDRGRLRTILHRASLAEMVVPYGDPSANQHWRNSFDVGEGAIGRHTTSLRLGCDCLGEITYLDAVVADVDGTPTTIENAICIHEEDFNVGWKHVYAKEGISEVRRSRRLVVSSWATLGNYDYGFAWHLYTDGRIEFEVKLTGILYTGAADGPPRYGSLLTPGLYAPNHQHIFCIRLDPEVDGPANTVVEVDVLPEPPTIDDPYHVAFRPHATPLERERDAVRDLDVQKARTWTIVNESARNAVGSATGFKLVPQAGATMLAAPDSFVARIAGFARHALWVTADDPSERHPAGEFPAWGDRGLPQWIEANRPVRDTEIVVWHCFATTHVPRPEDWPVMPVDYAGFQLKPFGFFDRNPALDLPSPHGGGRCHRS
jgi:primary-amine oxidase